MAFTTAGGAALPTVGYVRIDPGSGALFRLGRRFVQFQRNNTLVSETGVGTSRSVRGGRFYVETSTSINTGLALANPNAEDAEVSFYFTDEDGANVGPRTIPIPATKQLSKFVTEAPFNAPVGFAGMLTFSSSVAVGGRS